MKSFIIVLSFIFSSLFASADTWLGAEFYQKLQTDGVVGEVHGVSVDQNLFVWTYRNPQNFFQYQNFTMVAQNERIQNVMNQIQRHDQVWIKAQVIDNGAPQEHLLIEDLKITQAYHPSPDVPPYDHQTDLPAELSNQNEADFLVHAVDSEHGILVTEYKDSIVPILVGGVLKKLNLYRGDLIHVKYKIMKHPESPVHLKLLTGDASDLQVLQSLVSVHGQVAKQTGSLILFPKSPQIIFNVFAVEEIVAGCSRQYTIVNFDSPELFAAIRAKLQAAWDDHQSTVVASRNKLTNPKVQVTVSGVYNVQSPSQANPQILVSSVDDVVIQFLD